MVDLMISFLQSLPTYVSSSGNKIVTKRKNLNSMILFKAHIFLIMGQ